MYSNDDWIVPVFFILIIVVVGVIFYFGSKEQSFKDTKNWNKVEIECADRTYEALKYNNDWSFQDIETNKKIWIPENCVIMEQ